MAPSRHVLWLLLRLHHGATWCIVLTQFFVLDSSPSFTTMPWPPRDPNRRKQWTAPEGSACRTEVPVRMNAGQLKAFDEANQRNQKSAPSPTAKIDFLGDDESAAAVGAGGNRGVVWGAVGWAVGWSVVGAVWTV